MKQILLLFIVSFVIISCKKYPEEIDSTITGTWITQSETEEYYYGIGSKLFKEHSVSSDFFSFPRIDRNRFEIKMVGYR